MLMMYKNESTCLVKIRFWLRRTKENIVSVTPHNMLWQKEIEKAQLVLQQMEKQGM